MSYHYLLDLALILLSTKFLGIITGKFQMPRVVAKKNAPFGKRTGEFRPLRRATRGFASGLHHLLKKVDENFGPYSTQ